MKKNVSKIINYLKNSYNEDILVLCDFDDTLTKAVNDDGKKASSSCSVFYNNPSFLSYEYCLETNELFNYYYHIEQDPDLNNLEKECYMNEWWEKEFNLYKKYGLTIDILFEVVNNKLIDMREKTNEFFKILNDNNVPIIIFSAGNYNLIHMFLKNMHEDFNNIHVISNILDFDDKGFYKGVKGDIITSMNKNFHELERLHIFDELKLKKNCILIGNTTSDVNMAKGMKYEKILKIGFLNENRDSDKYNKKLKEHEKHFDLVFDIADDFEKVNMILRDVFNN